MTTYATVAVPVPLGQAFSYRIPDALVARATPGARVLCEFGRRRVLGVVLSTGDAPAGVPLDKIKALDAVVDGEPTLPPELLAFLVELSSYYLSPVGEVMRLALPAVERSRIDDQRTLSLLEETRTASLGKLVQVAEAVADVASTDNTGGRYADLVEALRRDGATPVADLAKNFGNARAALKKLEKLGLVRISKRPAETDPFFASPSARDEPPELTSAQAHAVDKVTTLLDAGTGGGFLLHGVTASGKTEVYLRAVARVLERGGGAIVLVPEIALTPQLVQRFRARLGDTIAVLHSGLKGGERHAMWTALRNSSLRVAVGARSALFAPVQDLRLICVDEEHDASFKQEEGVRYHARDMSLLRAHRARAVCVLGSATPSVTTEQLVRSGKLERLTLPDRARRAAVLPKVEIVDLRRVGAGPSGDKLLSLPLHRALERTLAAKEQAILFLNRRGFSPSVICEECGHLFECPNCAVALTVHRARGEHVICHYCDYRANVPSKCPECKSDRLGHEGAGTERVEALLKTAFPDARVARLDRDVAAGLKSEAILERMRRREIDVLVGTQMVTKGHDLPSVTLVGVLNADAALSIPDFQASERTFQLLVQVAGRAGRGDVPGIVVVQTRNPAHPAIAMAISHDVVSFIDKELVDRSELGYPPFSRIALVRIEALDESLARAEAGRLATIARGAATEGADIVGPAAAPIARLRSYYRHRFLVRAKARPALRRVLAAITSASPDRRVRMIIDVDPVNML